MRYLSFLLFCLGAVSADEIKPVPDPIGTGQIHLPTKPVNTEPDDPKPEEPSAVIGTLSADQFYVIESTAKLITLSSPEGLVSFEETPGPIRVRGLFVDGSGKIETRTYSSPYVYFVTAVASGKTELILIPEGVTSQDHIVRQMLTVTVGPRPPPIPPEPGPDPHPVASHVRISVITDTDNVSVEAAAVLNGLVGWNELFDMGSDYRLYDIQTTEPDGKKAIEQLNGPAPGIVIADKATGAMVYHGPLPATFGSLKSIVKEALGG